MTPGDDSPATGNRDARRATELDVRIGSLIREQRLLQNLAQDQLARAVGVTQHQLQKYETGENRIAASRLVECSRALNVPVGWFYRSIGTPAQGTLLAGDLTADERLLLDAFRGLDAVRQTQLIEIARIIRASTPIAQQKMRRIRRP